MLRINKVTLTLGKLTCVEPQTLRWAIETTFEETLANNAEIEILESQAKVFCDHCKKEFSPEDLLEPCPHCNQFGFTVISGNDMLVTAMEGV